MCQTILSCIVMYLLTQSDTTYYTTRYAAIPHGTRQYMINPPSNLLLTLWYTMVQYERNFNP